MGQTTIEWTATMQESGIVTPGYTWNPWIGCQKVSPGCKFCYAETLMDHRYGRVKWGPQGTRERTSPANWKKPLQWNQAAKANGHRYKVFCASLADVFEDRPELAEWRAGLFQVIDQCDHLDWLLLTKRPENVNRMVADAMLDCEWLRWKGTNPRNNIWVGTSAENQAAADERIPHLLNVPAAVHFLSCEPLLGSLSFEYESDLCHCGNYAEGHGYDCGHTAVPMMGNWLLDGIDWVIAGGESGPNARPMHPDWARSLRNQCEGAGVPFFFKQWGEWAPQTASDETWKKVMYGKADVYTFADGTFVYSAGKKAAGRLLDGVEWSQMPVAKMLD